jgi:hypothetical protein
MLINWNITNIPWQHSCRDIKLKKKYGKCILLDIEISWGKVSRPIYLIKCDGKAKMRVVYHVNPSAIFKLFLHILLTITYDDVLWSIIMTEDLVKHIK